MHLIKSAAFASVWVCNFIIHSIFYVITQSVWQQKGQEWWDWVASFDITSLEVHRFIIEALGLAFVFLKVSALLSSRSIWPTRSSTGSMSHYKRHSRATRGLTVFLTNKEHWERFPAPVTLALVCVVVMCKAAVLTLGLLVALLGGARSTDGPPIYGVKLCGREFIRAVIFTCGGSRWRRSLDVSGMRQMWESDMNLKKKIRSFVYCIFVNSNTIHTDLGEPIFLP